MWATFIAWVFGRILIPPGAAAEDEELSIREMIRIDIPNG